MYYRFPLIFYLDFIYNSAILSCYSFSCLPVFVRKTIKIKDDYKIRLTRMNKNCSLFNVIFYLTRPNRIN